MKTELKESENPSKKRFFKLVTFIKIHVKTTKKSAKNNGIFWLCKKLYKKLSRI